MKTVKILFLVATITVTSSCTDAALLFLNTLARFGDYTAVTDIAYGNHNNQTLDIYLPNGLQTNKESELTTVIFFYGGCWGACSDLKKEDYRFIAQAFTTNNIIAVIVNYRTYPHVLFSQIMEDAALSVEWINTNLAAYSKKSSKIYLMGHSAGAHIASMLNFNEKYLSRSTYKGINGFIGLAGAYDFLPFDEPYQPTLFAPPAEYYKSQTINFVEGNEPASLLLYGNNDTRVKRRNILSLSKVITEKAGRVESLFYDDIDHAGIISALSIPFQNSKPVLKDILGFIKRSNRL